MNSNQFSVVFVLKLRFYPKLVDLISEQKFSTWDMHLIRTLTEVTSILPINIWFKYNFFSFLAICLDSLVLEILLEFDVYNSNKIDFSWSWKNWMKKKSINPNAEVNEISYSLRKEIFIFCELLNFSITQIKDL